MRRKYISLIILILIFTLPLASLTTTKVASSPATVLKVDPPAVKADIAQTFNITVEVTGVEEPGLFTWQFRLTWNATILEYQSVQEGPFLKQGGIPTLFVKNLNQTAGYLDASCTRTGQYTPGVTGDGILATVFFLVETTGDSDLNLTNTLLIEPYSAGFALMPHEVQSGHFSTLAHDVAVTGVTLSETWINPGDLVTINVTVQNKGDFTETFNVTTYYDETAIAQKNATLDAKQSTIVTFVWDTTSLGPGDFLIRAVASFVPSETDKTNNEFIFGYVGTPRHDVAVTGITFSSKEVERGQTITVTVTVQNIGNFTETFDVALYYEPPETKMTTLTTPPLEAGTSTTLTYNWDTSAVSEGSYLIKAVADTVPGEIATDDNTFKTPFSDAVKITGGTQSTFPIMYVGIAIGAIAAIGLVGFFLMRRRSAPKTK